MTNTAKTAALRLIAAISLMAGQDGTNPDEALDSLDWESALESAEETNSIELRDALESLENWYFDS